MAKAVGKRTPVYAAAGVAAVIAIGVMAAPRGAPATVSANNSTQTGRDAADTTAAHSQDLLDHPEKATTDETLNIRHYGHYWDQTQAEREADAAWDQVTADKTAFPEEGGDIRLFNARLTADYGRWVKLESAAYGEHWQGLWQERHKTGSPLDCASMAQLGMPKEACYGADATQAEVEPLGPMLMKCRSGGTVMPMDEVSCRTHGRSSSYSRARELARGEPGE